MVIEGSAEIEKQVGWNLASGIIQEINHHLQNASNNYVKGQYGKAFDFLKAVAMRICSNLEEDELKELQELENKLHLLRLSAKDKTGFKVPLKSKQASYELWKSLDQYNFKLMVYLKKYGYLIPPKKDKSQMTA